MIGSKIFHVVRRVHTFWEACFWIDDRHRRDQIFSCQNSQAFVIYAGDCSGLKQIEQGLLGPFESSMALAILFLSRMPVFVVLADLRDADVQARVNLWTIEATEPNCPGEHQLVDH